MAQANANEYWSENVKEHFHTPPGTFTQDAEEITNILLKVSDGNATLALRRLLFYMNRAGTDWLFEYRFHIFGIFPGSRLGNAEQLEKAKKRLEELIEQNHETLKN